MNPITLAAPSLPEATPLELVDAAAAAGFSGLGLRLCASKLVEQPFHPIVGNAALITQIRRRLSETGLMLLDIYTFYLTSDFDFDACRVAMAVGAELGAQYAVVVGHGTAGPHVQATFERICDIAGEFGMTAIVEFAPHLWPPTLARTLQLLRDADRPNAAIMPDPSHFLRSGATIADLRTIDRKYLRYSQLCDVEFVGEEFLPNLGRIAPKTRRRLPGEGTAPLSQWLDALPAGLPISVECTPPPQGMSQTDWAKAIYTSTRKTLEDYYARKSATSSSANEP
ncbi:MAG: sugar phosphate isomerase/epimerase, partial [Gammaproteobacteria bacterium]